MANGQKAQQKRERNQKKQAGQKKGGSDQKAAAVASLTNVCDICKTAFMCTMSKAVMEQHVESKHSGKQFSDCFPNYNPKASAELKAKNKAAKSKNA